MSKIMFTCLYFISAEQPHVLQLGGKQKDETKEKLRSSESSWDGIMGCQ